MFVEPWIKIYFLDLQSFHQFRDWNVGAHNGAQLKAVDEFQLGSLALKNLSSIWIQYLWISSEKKTVLLFYVSGASIQIFLAENWSLCISKFNLNKSTRSQKFSFTQNWANTNSDMDWDKLRTDLSVQLFVIMYLSILKSCLEHFEDTW